nr:helix-turn-helix domain-containing protein [Lacrimispora amygdalina]
MISCRIIKSREFPEDPSLTIAEIAQNTGFSSQSYFTNCFKRIFGCTPNKYRKQ